MKAPRGTDMAKLVTLIETKAVRGQGTPDDPSRYVFQYWDFEGNMVAESDSINEDSTSVSFPSGIITINGASENLEISKIVGSVLNHMKKAGRV